MPSAAISLKCPQCGSRVSAENPSFPFCCKRCRLIDLGKWFNGEYAVPGEDIDRVEIPEGKGEASDPNE